jgi:CheY-like chemotaxis protein
MALPAILVVDDEARLCGLVAEALRDEGWPVLEATSGEAALALLDREPSLALVLTDRKMPGIDGVQLFDRIRARPRYAEVPIAFFSATGDDAGRPVTLIPKPVRLEALFEAVRAIIGPPAQRR